MWLLIVLVAVPIIEIALFIQVGGVLGFWPTIAIVIATAFLGSWLLRQQGLQTLSRLQASVATGSNPMEQIAHGALILVSGIVLLTPGFFTDALGLALLLPPVRSMAIRWGAARMMASSNINAFAGMAGQPGAGPGRADTVEGDFTVVDEEATPGESGWTKIR